MKFEPVIVSGARENSLSQPNSTLTVLRDASPSGSSFHNTTDKNFLRELFTKEPCVYSHKIYKEAAAIFNSLKLEAQRSFPVIQSLKNIDVDNENEYSNSKTIPERIPVNQIKCDREKQLAYELVFNTLKYQRFLEDILEDCGFFYHYPEFKDDHGLVLVMFYDFKQRKFQLRTPLIGETCDSFLSEIEQALLQIKTKLNASLARKRIKAQVLTLDELLPDSVRQTEKDAVSPHVYCWVNQLKTSFNAVVAELESDGFTSVMKEADLIGVVYMVDQASSDALFFPSEQRSLIQTHKLTLAGNLVMQDRSSCIGPESIKHMINEGDDIIHVNVGSGLITAHIASLMHFADTTIFAFGVLSDQQYRQVHRTLEKLGALGKVKLIRGNFEDIEPTDERFKNIKLALLSAECSRSAILDPVNFLVTEGEDLGILKCLSQGNVGKSQLSDLVLKHYKELIHLLKFAKIQAAIYCTRSVNEAENQGVVNRAVEFTNIGQQKKNAASFRVTPPVIPFSQDSIENEEDSMLDGKYIQFSASSKGSGFFLATITKESNDPQEAAKNVLARAAAKGLVSGLPAELQNKKSQSKISVESEVNTSKSRKSQFKIKKSTSRMTKKVPNQVTKNIFSEQKADDKIAPVSTINTANNSITHQSQSPFNSSIQVASTSTISAPPLLKNYTIPEPFSLSKDIKPKPTIPYSPPEHRKVVQHPKPFRS